MGAWIAATAAVGQLRGRRWRISIPLGAALFIAFVAAWTIHASSAATVWKREFGSAVPAGVVDLHSGRVVTWPDGSAHLRFKAPPAIIATLVARAGMLPTTTVYAFDGRPDWFTPTTTATIYATTANRGGFGSETRVLYYDPAAGDAWYEFVGID
jgi:hypothetical protein